VQDQPSISPDSSEPPRPRTIPDDFIWDEETQGWYPPGEPSNYDPTEWRRRFEEARQRGEFDGGLISVDDLRAAGALDIPPEWRKSLASESRYTLPGFDDDEVADAQNDSQIDDAAGDPIE
jgi:hypothetical protein